MSQEPRGLSPFDSKIVSRDLIVAVRAVLVFGKEQQGYYRLSSLTHGELLYVGILPAHVNLGQVLYFIVTGRASPSTLPLVLLSMTGGYQQWLILAPHE